MKIYRLLLLTLFISFCSSAIVKIDYEGCKEPDRATDTDMIDAMDKDMRIDINAIDRARTRSVIIASYPIDKPFSRQIARDSYRKDPDNWLSLKDYTESHSENNPRNLIIEFTYFNKNNKKNIFLVSSSVNDYECAIHFNGYLVVKREF